jgi:hypothetical protein
MSTSTGEEGFCVFCGHLMSAHTDAKHSKCTKCKNRILVCQANNHAGRTGWRICDVSCGCGSKYYPSTAKEAYPLYSDEYASSHPLYESPPEGEDNTFDSYSSPQASSMSASNPAYVDVTKTGQYFQFIDYDANPMYSTRDNWQQTLVDYKGVKTPAWQMTDSTGLSYFTWSLDVPDSQEGYAEQSERSRGKQVACSHGRTLSEESIDQLQWDEAQLEANSVASAMAGLTLGGSSSRQAESSGSQDRVLVSARLDSKGRVVFKRKDGGDEMKSSRECWDKEKGGGYVFESRKFGCTFFTKEIKQAKK